MPEIHSQRQKIEENLSKISQPLVGVRQLSQPLADVRQLSQRFEIEATSRAERTEMDNNQINETDGVVTSMQNNMESSLSSINYKCSIYKVPDFSRKESEENYRPRVISIGPIFYEDAQLQTMKLLKWIFLESFLKHPKNACGILEPYINMVRDSLEEIRQHYQQQQQQLLSSSPSSHKYDDDEFIQMIVLDAIFLLSYIMLGNNDLPIRRHVPKVVLKLWSHMRRDIFLVENQVPFLVLKRIFGIAFPTEQPTPFLLLIDLTRKFIVRCNFSGSTYVVVAEIDANVLINHAAHILDFYWKCCCLPYHTTHLKEKEKEVHHHHHHLPSTAKQLSDAGVQFKVSDDSLNPLSVTFNNRTGELHLPKLFIYGETEAILRSILFFEQCHYKKMLSFVDLFVFLGKLITNVEDVQILLNSGIIENHIGSIESSLNIFKKINKNNVYNPSEFNYSSVSQEVNKYANKRWNRWRAILWRDYFNHPWAILSFIFAVILFILTLLQTINSFINN